MSKDKLVKLKVDWATYEAAAYACQNWHYSKSVPCSKLVKIGVWENDTFTGALIFSPGAIPQIGSPYGLDQLEICELTRVALKKHATQVSRILSIAIKFLQKRCPGLKLIVSYADLDQGHHGGIYQGSNWIYAGRTKPDFFLKVKGVVEHRKTVYDRYGNQSLSWLQKHVDPNATRIPDNGKHKYLMPLEKEMRAKVLKLSKPYPKRAGSVESSTSVDQIERGGESPTSALQSVGGVNGTS